MAETDKKPRFGVWRIVLVLSLALNLLVLGGVVGAFLSPDGPRGEKQDRAARDIGATPFFRALEPAQRQALVRNIRQEEEPLRRNREELKLRFDALVAAIEAPVFDPEEVRSLLSLQRIAATERQELGEALLVQSLSEMSLEERVAFAEKLRTQIQRGPHHRDKN